eukprot:scaffold3821_cov127-Cylindrotheca_fusiformis.AAC.10
MDSFSEWVNTADHPCFQEWGSLAVELGASWDSFRRVDKDVIVQDLVKGGIPILAARDMTVIASKEIQRNQAPMAIFWDLENMPIPTEASGRDIVTSLKSILAPLGDLIQFRGYASIGLNHIPQEKRSDLQLSGCHLVDCPHHGRKEVADKMIIVDAMQFAFQHPDVATLCLITGDSDYAYLLATLQRPQWRTIVISRGTMQSMLHVNCDMKMRWETDILQPIYSGVSGTPGTEEEISTEPTGRWASLFRPLSADEGWKDDVELLRTVIKQQGQNHGTLAPLKSLVGNILRNTNPARFPQRINIQGFLARAIAEGVVVEKGEKQYKTLCLPMHANHSSTSPLMPLAKMLPAKFEQFPLKVVDMARATPFIVLLRRAHCPPGETPPSKAYVQSSSEWLFYMFASYRIALEAVASHRWLCQGTLVDIRQIEEIPLATAVRSSSREGNVSCSVCSAMIADSFATEDASGRFYCSVECQEFTKYSPARVKKGILEGYDDIYVPHDILDKKMLDRKAWIEQRKDEMERLAEEKVRQKQEEAKRLDCLVRAIRIEELPLVKAKYEEMIRTDRAQYEHEIEQEIEKAQRAKVQWDSDKRDKERLSVHSVFDWMEDFESTVLAGRQLNHEALCAEAEAEAIVEAVKAKIERARKRKQNEARRLSEEEEAKRRQEEEQRRNKEEARREREAKEEERRREVARMAEDRERNDRQSDRGQRSLRALDYVPPSRRGQGAGEEDSRFGKGWRVSRWRPK